MDAPSPQLMVHKYVHMLGPLFLLAAFFFFGYLQLSLLLGVEHGVAKGNG